MGPSSLAVPRILPSTNGLALKNWQPTIIPRQTDEQFNLPPAYSWDRHTCTKELYIYNIYIYMIVEYDYHNLGPFFRGITI